MARSWHYPRWRRILAQVVLWLVLGATLGVAALVVRHKRLVGSVDLAEVRTVDLPNGGRLGVRLPRKWAVDHDAGEHAGESDDTGDDFPASTGGRAVREIQAHEPAGGVDGSPDDGDADAGDIGHTLVVYCQPLRDVMPAKAYLDTSGVLAHARELVDEAGRPLTGTVPLAGVDGFWTAAARRVPTAPGLPAVYHAVYAAAAVVPAGPMSAEPLAVTVVLDCPPGDTDVVGDRDLLHRVAAAITVDRGRPPAVPSRPRMTTGPAGDH